MKIAVASGKGGTGKTTIAVNLALSLDRKVRLLDCDVEEPNSNIFLDIPMKTIEEVVMWIPKIDYDRCTFCGKCAELCEYNALAVLEKEVLVFEELCHSCGLCSIGCTEDAITEKKKKIGVIEKGIDKNIEFYDGVLDVGEALSTPIIRELKKNVKEGINILDVPPGTGCPVVESLSRVDYAILVTEQTPFGLHDLEISVKVARKLGIPFGVIINRDREGYSEIENYCEKEDIQILMKIPQNMRIARLYSDGVPFVKSMDSWKEKFKEVYKIIEGAL